MDTLKYTIVLEPAEEGGFNVSVPALPGCFTQGETYEEAIVMAQDAISLWLEELANEGQPIPDDTVSEGMQVTTVEVAPPAAST